MFNKHLSLTHIKYLLSWIIMKQFKKPFWSHLKYNVILIMMFLNNRLADSCCFMSNISNAIKLHTNTTQALSKLWAHVHMLWSDCDLIALSQWLTYNRGPHTRSWVDRQATYSIQTSQWDCQTQEMTYDVSAFKSTTSQRDWKKALGGELVWESECCWVEGAGLPGKHVYQGSIRCIIFPVAQLVEHGASNAKIMGLIPRESKSW